jgi:hypothetical protein
MGRPWFKRDGALHWAPVTAQGWAVVWGAVAYAVACVLVAFFTPARLGYLSIALPFIGALVLLFVVVTKAEH